MGFHRRSFAGGKVFGDGSASKLSGGDIVRGGIQFASGAISAADYRRQQEAYEKQIQDIRQFGEQRTQQGLADFDQRSGQFLQFNDRFGNQLQGDISGFNRQANTFAQGRMGFADQFDTRLQGGLGQFDQRSAGINQAFGQLESGVDRRFGDLRSRLLGNLEGAGAQEREDITSASESSRQRGLANLQSRGLGGSTITGSFESASERDRTAAFGRLNDRLIQQRLGVDMDVSGAQLSAQQNLGLSRIGALTGQSQFGANLQSNAAFNAFAAQQGISGDQLNTMMRGQDRSLGATMGVGNQRGQFLAGQPGQFANLQGRLTGDQLSFEQSILERPQAPQFSDNPLNQLGGFLGAFLPPWLRG